MDGTAAACNPVTHSRVRFSLATAHDDAGIRALLRTVEMQGDIRLTFEREPNAFAADAHEEGPVRTIVAKNGEGDIVAIGSRVIRTLFVNGEPTRVGYLSQLRVHPDWRGRDLLLGGYAFLRELHEADPVPFYLTSILSENHRARRLLEANVTGLPRYRPIEEWCTFALPCRGRGGLVETPSRSNMLDNSRFQFASTSACPGECIGVRNASASLWDQSECKQTVVRGYGGSLRRWRPMINLLGPLIGWPRLPAVGQRLRQVFLTNMTIEDDDVKAFDRLLVTAKSVAQRSADWLIVGLSSRRKLAHHLRRHWKHRELRSILYAVHWEDGHAAVDALDGRIAHVETAML